MGAFICSISERDWEISRAKGIYGNKIGNIGQSGKYRKFSAQTQFSIIRDLVGMQKGDKVFFHVLANDGPSRIHGIYIVREPPFYDATRIWKDSYEIFPYRFLFEPYPKYRYLCEYDANIEVVEFYELIEQRKIWSLATLENEMNIEARSVRKIEDGGEAKETLRLLHRDYRMRRQEQKVNFSPISLTRNARPLREFIKDIGRFENSIKALLMYKLGQKDPALVEILGPISDFMNEVFIAQTTRKCMDILCIGNSENQNKKYIICEVKTDRCTTKDLSQLLFYMDLFKRREIVNIHSDLIIGSLIGKKFDSEVIDFSRKRNAQNVNGSILLIEYTPNEQGTDASFRRIT